FSGHLFPMGEQYAETHEHAVSARALRGFLWQSIRALLPTLTFDIAGTMGMYYVLLPHFGSTSIWPILGASLVPVISNVFNFVRRHTFDVVGIIVLLGLLVGLVPAVFGGSQRLLLVRESFFTGLLGVILLISALRQRPLAYYVIREFLTANEALPHERWDHLWRSGYFRHTIRAMTIGWGALLVGEFVLRGFMALRMNIAFVLGAGPVLITILLLIAGLFTAFWLAHAIRVALSA
ncbi:MAG TPA: VC0807 family protein, partial [Candidatus Baltobacteraceae bacterium]